MGMQISRLLVVLFAVLALAVTVLLVVAGPSVALPATGIASRLALIVPVLAFAAAVASAIASSISAATAKSALEEAKRQWQLSAMPSISAFIGRRGDDGVSELKVVNEGHGLARSVTYALEVVRYDGGATPKPVQYKGSEAQLGPGTSRFVFKSIVDCEIIAGLVTYEDIEGGKHWSRFDERTGNAWEFGAGEPPRVTGAESK